VKYSWIFSVTKQFNLFYRKLYNIQFIQDNNKKWLASSSSAETRASSRFSRWGTTITRWNVVLSHRSSSKSRRSSRSTRRESAITGWKVVLSHRSPSKSRRNSRSIRWTNGTRPVNNWVTSIGWWWTRIDWLGTTNNDYRRTIKDWWFSNISSWTIATSTTGTRLDAECTPTHTNRSRRRDRCDRGRARMWLRSYRISPNCPIRPCNPTVRWSHRNLCCSTGRHWGGTSCSRYFHRHISAGGLGMIAWRWSSYPGEELGLESCWAELNLTVPPWLKPGSRR